MPCQSVAKHRIQRQFFPSSGRVRFESERLLTPPPLSAKTKFSLLKPDSEDDQAVPRQNSACDVPATSTNANVLEPTIAKPDGQVCRPRRGGYTLSEKLGWDSAKYENFLVSTY